MIPLKEHNNIVQTLMKEISNRQSEIKSIQKERLKINPQIPQLGPTPNEQLLNKKISQLNKQFKQRINNLTQQLRSKSQQNKDLKERLVTKANIQAKEKQHIAEILKKTYDRKPSSGADYKISALISHYDTEIAKKNKFIQSLQKQIQQHEINNPDEIPLQNNENYKSGSENEDKPKAVTLVQHQQQIAKIKAEVQKFRKLHEEKDKQYKDLSRRYTQLTNEYYKILNSYGIQQPKKTNIKICQKATIKSDSACRLGKKPLQIKSNPNALQNLLQQMIGTDSQTQETCIDKQMLKSSTRSLQSQVSEKSLKKFQYEQQQADNGQKQQWAASKLQQVLHFYNLSNANDLLPYLCKTKTKLQQYELADTVTRTLQTFFYNIGKGRIAREQLVSTLQNLQLSYNRNLEAVDTLDEICIQVGAKRQKLVQKLHELLQIKQEYYEQLRSLKFSQELAKGNKLIQFIDFFNLDKEQVALPQQLKNLQEQLKHISKFVKQARIILDIDAQKSFQMVLQLVLRYLQKTCSLVNKLQKKIQKPKPTPN